MFEKNFVFWWFCAFLFIPSFSNHQQNITKSEVDDNLTMRYEIKKNSTINLQTYRDLMRIEGKNDSVSYETFNKTSNEIDNKYNVVPYEMCANITCIPLCCPLGNRLDDDDKCMPENIKYSFPNIYTNDLLQSEKKVDELFQLTVYDPCQTYDRFLLPYGYQYNFKIFTNGSLYLSYYEKFIKRSLYCLAVIENNKFEVTFCANTFDEITGVDTKSIENINILYVSLRIVSTLFLVSIFLVYSILPELRNVHGFILCNYSGSLSVAYIIDIVNVLVKANGVQYLVCLTIAFFNYLCLLTSCFWLTIMSFDVWWTLRGLCLLRRNIKQREKNKLVFYAIYAWGLPFILAVTSIIMNSVSENLPQISQSERCRFAYKWIYVLFYGLQSICIISSIGLSISTAMKIARYKKDTSHLTDLENKQYKDYKKWFNLYLKLFILLFIVMGIKWSMIIFYLTKSLYNYTISLVDIIQNLCIFIIFVYKKKIKRMLLKRFGCGVFVEAQSTNAISLNSINCATTSGETSSM